MSRLASITILILGLSAASQSYLSWRLQTTQQDLLRRYDRMQSDLAVVEQVVLAGLQWEARRLQGTALPSGTVQPPPPTGETLLRAVLLPNDTGHATLGGYVRYDSRCLPERAHPPGGQAEELTVSSATPTRPVPSHVEAATDRLLWTISPSRP